MALKLPVCGDWIDQALVCGVSARGLRGCPSVVTVWIAPNDEDLNEVHVFTQFEVATLARAQQVRDQIATLCGLDGDADDTFDPEDPDAEGSPGDEDDSTGEDHGSEGGGLLGAAPEERLTPAEAAEILHGWEPISRSVH